MKIILKEDVSSLGKIGDIINVSDGYARNYLIPKNLAIPATEKNLRLLEHQKKLIMDKLNRTKKEAETLAKKIESLSCTISRQAGEEDKLFGSVTAMDIEDALKKEGINISKKQVILEHPIKTLGVYTIPIKLQSNIEAKLKLWVVKE